MNVIPADNTPPLPGMVPLLVWGFRCERCPHVWLPRDSTRAPKVCPRCKSPYWDRPRRHPKPVEDPPFVGDVFGVLRGD